MRVMLVDDSVTMRRIQKNQFNKLGITDIVEAGDGVEGMEMLQKSMPVEIVFLDWNMPFMNGLEFLKKAREMDQYKDVKIFMCTSEADKYHVMDAVKAGANDYIVKPFTPEALKQKLGL